METKTTTVKVFRKKGKSRRRSSPRQGAVLPWAVAAKDTPLFPVSQRQTHQLYYDWGFNLSPVAGTASFYYFSCNGAFDPDVSGTGHQPMGFDQMMLLYEQYTVVASTISVTFISAGGAGRVGILLSPDTSAGADPSKLVENGLCKWHCMDAAASSGGTGQRIVTVEQSFNTAKFFGRQNDRVVVNDPDLFGTTAANPTEQAYFAVGGWAFPSQSGTTVIDFDVLIKYDVVYWEPRKLAKS